MELKTHQELRAMGKSCAVQGARTHHRREPGSQERTAWGRVGRDLASGPL